MNELETPIGTKESVKLSPGSVVVKRIAIEPPKEGSKAKLVNLYLLHPDREEPIRVSKIKVKKIAGNSETIKVETLWLNLDEDDKIRKNSSPALLMNFYGKTSLKEFENSSVTTEADASGYLCIKAY